ncbi:MAG: hypothetical protein CSA68_09725 [Rhodobacterales bacterium]|nr:MAG: hypothetical protein CSA68_09725 [Rhodobacterales bacterium]
MPPAPRGLGVDGMSQNKDDLKEEDFEVHVFATTDEDGYSDGLEPAGEPDTETPVPPAKTSTGLIRFALLGLLLVLVIFMIHRLWGAQIARYYLNEPSLEAQFAPIDPLVYSEVVDGWSAAYNTLNASRARQSAATDQKDKAQTGVTVLEKALKLTEQDLASSIEGKDQAQRALEEADQRVATLSQSDLPARLQQAKVQVEADQGRLQARQADLDAARADFKQMEQTVEQLGRATEAAVAAMEASEAALAAASSAGRMIAENEGEESENSSLLARLTFNLFSESQPQISGAERSVEIASEALATGEAKLVEASEIEAEHEEKYNAAKAELDKATAHMNDLQKQVNRLQKDQKAAAKALKAAQAAHQAASDDLQQKKLVNQQAITKLAEAREALNVAKSKYDVVSDEVAAAQESFDVAAAELSALRKRRARRNAVVLAEVNAAFSDMLREKLGISATTDPTSDRFALPSEVLFSSGAADLGAEGRKELDQMAAVLKQTIKTIPADVDWVLRVDGHTDDKPFSSNSGFRDNWQLSQARSLAVVKYLISQHKIAPQHLAANGFGQYQPIRPVKSEADLAINRRIELFLTPK